MLRRPHSIAVQMILALIANFQLHDLNLGTSISSLIQQHMIVPLETKLCPAHDELALHCYTRRCTE